MTEPTSTFPDASSSGALRRWLTFAFLGTLFFVGYVHWMLFLNLASPSYFTTIYDWGKHFRYYNALQEGLREGEVPWHSEKREHHTHRLLAIPEVNTSPQIILLKYTSIENFILFNTLLFYSLGFVGCLLLRQRYRLGLTSFTVLYALFNFNGFIVAHLGSAHPIWTGYFLFPFFILLVMRMLEERPERVWIPMALLLLAMVLQGFFHGYNWCVLFLALLAIFTPRVRRAVVLAIVASLVLSLCRFAPAAMTLSGYDHPFFTGFPTVLDWLSGMLVPHGFDGPVLESAFGRMTWGEFNFYIGVPGFVFLLWFGVRLCMKPDAALERWRYPELDWPMVWMTILSLNYFMAVTRLIPLPLVGTEALTARFFILPMLFLVLLGVIRMEHGWTAWKGSRMARVLLWAAIFHGVGTLWDHATLWPSFRFTDEVVKRMGIDPTNPLIEQPDPVYKAVVIASALISAAALFALLFLWWKQSRVEAPTTAG